MLRNNNIAPQSPLDILQTLIKQKKCTESFKQIGKTIEYTISYNNHVAIETYPVLDNVKDALKLTKRIARYNGHRTLIKLLPEEYQQQLIISPLSAEYVVDAAINQHLSSALWDIQLPSKACYQLHMIAQMLNQKLKFSTEKQGKDHDPLFETTINFELLEHAIKGSQEKTKKEAEESAALLVYGLWKKTITQSNREINPKKLVVASIIKKTLKTKSNNARYLLGDVAQRLGWPKPQFKNYIVGGNVKKPKSKLFYSKVKVPQLTSNCTQSAPYEKTKDAQEEAAQKMLKICLTKLLE